MSETSRKRKRYSKLAAESWETLIEQATIYMQVHIGKLSDRPKGKENKISGEETYTRKVAQYSDWETLKVIKNLHPLNDLIGRRWIIFLQKYGKTEDLVRL